MKHTVQIMMFLMVGAIATGCNKDSKSQSDDPGTTAAQHEKAKEATQSIQDHVYARKGEFIDAAKQDLADIQAETERLHAAVERYTGAARADAEAKVAGVSDKWAAAKAQLDRVEAATEDSWEDVQDGYRTAQSELKDSFDDTRQWLSEQIEP